MSFNIIVADLSTVKADIIVTPANRLPRVNDGVDLAVHQRAGIELYYARENLGVIPAGNAAITPAYDLPAKWVIHAPAPVWVDGNHREIVTLRGVYDRCLDLALDKRAKSIAFPLLGIGEYGFPGWQAVQMAGAVFSDFLMQHEMELTLVVEQREDIELPERMMDSVRAYIKQEYLNPIRVPEARPYLRFSRGGTNRQRVHFARQDFSKVQELPPDIRNYLLENQEDDFADTLLAMIQARHLTNAAVYRKAFVSKQSFSKIINNETKTPRRSTALALAMALELTLPETLDLLRRAGYTLGKSTLFDLIVRFGLEHHEYSIVDLNFVLFRMEQPLIIG